MDTATARKGDFQVKTEHFEGPLDMLLQLIEKRKLFISDFSLAQVADEYIARVRGFNSFPVTEVVNFLVVASALVLIKSRSLLPELTLTEEEGESVDELKRRLALYEHFRDLATDIRARYGKSPVFERLYHAQDIITFAPDRRLSVEFLRSHLDQVIASLPKSDPLPKATIRKVVSLEEMLERLTKRISQALHMSFREFSKHRHGTAIRSEQKTEIIVGFLAMLELVKQGLLRATQEEKHGDIHMENLQLNIPSYS